MTYDVPHYKVLAANTRKDLENQINALAEGGYEVLFFAETDAGDNVPYTVIMGGKSR